MSTQWELAGKQRPHHAGCHRFSRARVRSRKLDQHVTEHVAGRVSEFRNQRIRAGTGLANDALVCFGTLMPFAKVVDELAKIGPLESVGSDGRLDGPADGDPSSGAGRRRRRS